MAPIMVHKITSKILIRTKAQATSVSTQLGYEMYISYVEFITISSHTRYKTLDPSRSTFIFICCYATASSFVYTNPS